MLVRRDAVAWTTADLTAAAVAVGNSDHVSATAPVTNGVAALVPPIVSGSVTPRLVTASPGAPSPQRPIEAPRLEICHWAPPDIRCDDRYDTRVASNDRAAARTLITGRRHDDHPATQSEIERLLKAAPAWRGAFQGDAQIDDPRSAIDNVEDGVGKLCGR